MIERFVKNSLKGDLFSKAIDCLKALREACVKEDEAQSFNIFMKRLKDLFQRGNNKEFFELVVKNKISLITKKESAISSNVTEEEAKQVYYIFMLITLYIQFLQVEVEKIGSNNVKKEVKDEDDLMDDI